jgi:hypothetical protein
MTLTKLGMFGLAFVIASSSSAVAVDVRQVVEIKAKPDAVWAKIGGWCAIKDWHPAIASCDESKTGFRTLTLKAGGKIVEKLTQTGTTSYSYDILESTLPVKNYTATLAAKADSLGFTDLTWTAKFDAKDKSEADAAGVITGIFTAGLKNIKDTVRFETVSAAAPVAVGTAAAASATAAAEKAAARAKAKKERQKKIEAAKVYALEKVAKAKEEFAKLRASLAEKAQVAADAAKANYERAKAAMSAAVNKATTPATPAPTSGEPKKP